MTITATEFKNHFGKYLELALKEDIFITKNNKRVAKLTKPSADGKSALDRIAGVAEDFADLSLDDIRKERLARQ